MGEVRDISRLASNGTRWRRCVMEALVGPNSRTDGLIVVVASQGADERKAMIDAMAVDVSGATEGSAAGMDGCSQRGCSDPTARSSARKQERLKAALKTPADIHRIAAR
jgi:hypothetical protein